MGLRLEKRLPHQVNAMVALNHVFRGVQITNGSKSYANPAIDLNSIDLKRNLVELKRGLPYQIDNSNQIEGYLNLDIKMETGTGKTYVYTQTIFELHKNYGLNKFIILVPSIAIKIGTTNFINSDETRRHFREIYGAEIDLTILDAKKNKKEVFPNAVREFVSASGLIRNQISVLVINNLVSQSSLTKNYSSGVEGFYNPVDAIKATKPIIIIDEPHRFGKDAKTFTFIQEKIKPQGIIRFGATFPDLKGGKKDYHNLIYNLGSCDSFNQNLIKGVKVTPLETPNGSNVKLKLKDVISKTSATFELNQNGRKTEKPDFKKGDSLGTAFSAFAGLMIEGIGKNFIELSNGLIMNLGEEIFADIYDKSYQESMIDVALDSHFKTEKSNFIRRDQIKTIALFFIDDISSYRGSSDRTPYLKEYFEKALTKKINDELSNIDKEEPREVEYEAYLRESLRDIQATHGGYFSQDNSDKEYEEEIEKILKKKEETISLRYSNGKFNTFRFIFSKWTLKEGWDNPNVFTIAKIRSSGSEISKIQEVGRGLRLPVNNSLSRVSSEQFYLNYIVDFTEKDFANKLIDEINGELKDQIILSEEVLKKVAKDNGYTNYHSFVGYLIDNDFINDELVVNTEKRDDLFSVYPDLGTGLASGKVIKVSPKAEMQNVKINKNNYAKLKNLWKSLNAKYFITYQPVNDEDIVNALVGILNSGIEKKVEVVAITKTVAFDLLEEALLEEGAQRVYTSDDSMKYNEFIMRVNKSTNISLKNIHNAFILYSKTKVIENSLFNRASLRYFIEKIIEWKKSTLFGRFKYEKIGLEPSDTSINDKNWNPRKTVTQGLLGHLFDKNFTPPSNYLYDLCVYDSKIEKENIQTDIEGVEVFGKIPKGSIRIPIINGGTYSPDFMYIVKKGGKVSELNLVIESKGYDKAEDIPVDELFKIKCAEEFFKQFNKDGIKVEFRTQINTDKIYNIVKELVQ